MDYTIRDEIIDLTTLESAIEELEFHTKFSFRYIPPKEKRYESSQTKKKN